MCKVMIHAGFPTHHPYLLLEYIQQHLNQVTKVAIACEEHDALELRILLQQQDGSHRDGDIDLSLDFNLETLAVAFTQLALIAAAVDPLVFEVSEVDFVANLF